MSAFGLLVVGAGRGGTSLLAGLLDAHPQLEVVIEEYTHPYLLGHGLGGAPGRERIAAFRAACDRAAGHSSTAVWGNKVTTEQIHGLSTAADNPEPIPLFFDAHDDVKTVFILRDGRACVASKVNRTGQEWETAAERWLFSLDVMREVERRGGLVVRFEDLVVDPVPQLEIVCGFVDVEYTETMFDGTSNEKLRPEYQLDGIDKSKAEPPEIPGEVLEMITPGLREVGYLDGECG